MSIPLDKYAEYIRDHQEQARKLAELEEKRAELEEEYEDAQRTASRFWRVDEISPEALPALILEIQQRLAALEDKSD